MPFWWGTHYWGKIVHLLNNVENFVYLASLGLRIVFCFSRIVSILKRAY